MRQGLVIGRVLGIEIRANWSIAVIGVLIAWSLAEAVLPEWIEGYSTGEYWVAAIVASIAFIAGIVAHELGHSIVALNEGVNVTSVTLWLFGGVAKLETQPTTPQSSLRIAAAGPAVSAALGLVALGLSFGFGGLIGACLAWFGVMSLVLAVFNLLPAFPLDGGRIYHAVLWARTGDERTATERAAALGQVIGGGLVLLGLAEVILLGTVGGLWLVMIGWFLREAGRAELWHMKIDRTLKEVPVSRVMTRSPISVDSATPVASFVTGILLEGRHASYPVLDSDGSVLGLVGLKSIQGLERDSWESTCVGDVCTPVDELVVVTSDTPVSELLSSIGERDGHRALVIDGGRLAGIVAPSDLARFIAVVELAGEAPAGARDQ